MVEIVTKEDLDNSFQKFKKELLEEIGNHLGTNKINNRKYLRSAEIRALLQISDSTLMRMRIKGLIKSKKIGGIHFYDAAQFQNL
jgi:hypothetical protein